MLRPLGWFVACLEPATPCRLDLFLILDGVHQGRRIIRNENGRLVKRIRQGVYELETGVRLTTRDPDAP
jgi:hypothetical protein